VTRPLRAVLYCRSRRNSVRALEAQEARCKRRAVDEGAETTVTIFDRGPAGPCFDRPAVSELLRLVRADLVDLVVVDTADCLSLRVRELRELLRQVAKGGARLVFVAP